jgi:hypothetical protein
MQKCDRQPTTHYVLTHLVQDVVVPIVQSGVSGAVGGYVAGKVGQDKKPEK